MSTREMTAQVGPASAARGKASLRVTDLAERLGIDAPAVTRKAQRLERLGLVSRGRVRPTSG